MMTSTWIITIGCVIILSETFGSKIDDGYGLPDGFLLGAATSAFQIEGAWNVSDKGESNWDYWTHHYPWLITDHSTIDVACNSYYKYKEDVQLVKNIGLSYYRFSISWPRVLPTGFTNKISADGIQYYTNLIDEVIANGLEPIVTIYHFDHPQLLEEMGGWTNKLMVDWFVDYARLIFKYFGAKVKIFLTINEPQKLCSGYKGLDMAPGKELLDIGEYLCIHNVLKAHAKTYRAYDKEFRKSYNGQISLTVPCDGYVLDKSNDTVAADTAFQFNCGIIAHPIYIGGYPPIVKKRIALISEAQGYSKSRLPEFSKEWEDYIKGTADFFGLNHYSSKIWIPDPDERGGKYNTDAGVIGITDRRWTSGSVASFKVVPEGFGNVLRKIKSEYNNPLVYIMENGYPDQGEISDYNRINYYHSYMTELLIAVKRDQCRVQRYTIWTLIDNYELNSGFAQCYGIVSVDFDSGDKSRIPKLSAYWWREIARTRRLQDVPRMHKTG